MKVPILLPNIFNHPFTYESDLNLKVGDYVVVPFGKSKITGVVWNEFEKKNNRNFKLKSILKKLVDLNNRSGRLYSSSPVDPKAFNVNSGSL